MSSRHINTEWFRTQAVMGLNSYIIIHEDGIYLVDDKKTKIKKSTLDKLIQKKLVVKKSEVHEVYIASWVFNSQAVPTTVAAS